MLTYFFTALAQEQTMAGLAKFDKSGLKSVDTAEKNTLPTKESWFFFIINFYYFLKFLFYNGLLLTKNTLILNKLFYFSLGFITFKLNLYLSLVD